MIVANMATFPAREGTLRAAVEALLPQVDRLNLCLNEYKSIPDWVETLDAVHAEIPAVDLKDLGKFMFDVSPEDDVILVDDDILYPGDYVQKAIDQRNKAEVSVGKPVVGGFHGTIYLRRSLIRFAKDVIKGRGLKAPHFGRAKILHAFHDHLARPRIVAQLGTGTVVTKGSLLPSLDYMMGAERRADVRFARWCVDQGYTQIALPRAKDWMPASENDAEAIYETYTQNLPKEFLEELSLFAFRVPQIGKYIG
jgi:hypothetical protein